MATKGERTGKEFQKRNAPNARHLNVEIDADFDSECFPFIQHRLFIIDISQSVFNTFGGNFVYVFVGLLNFRKYIKETIILNFRERK